MDRRQFLQCTAAAPLAAGGGIEIARASPHGRLLIVIDLVGGNDGLNTVIPFSDPRYFALRPTIAIDRQRVLPLDDRNALHPALRPLMPLWSAGELAILHGVGSAEASLSHHRASELMQAALPDFPWADAAADGPACSPAPVSLAQALVRIASGLCGKALFDARKIQWMHGAHQRHLTRCSHHHLIHATSGLQLFTHGYLYGPKVVFGIAHAQRVGVCVFGCATDDVYLKPVLVARGVELVLHLEAGVHLAQYTDQ